MVVVFLIFAKEPCGSKGIDERRESIPSYNNCSPLQKSLLRRAFFLQIHRVSLFNRIDI